ncbi:nucleoside phosphorylase domain-containing protein [Kickxella alabastrina]|uniref:nucleoside phosphorylase domain-containing protein n=1 Tax=Kickxella alabastrina TaxID=61397 RepID=UPI0022204777|nr:nucleoside phosphorylase domain-containing protein [Kickxella alabastrina]KAI7825428.1 nucleoside phosphorylase domain-containing protein [Kickxella alabastrina]
MDPPASLSLAAKALNITAPSGSSPAATQGAGACHSPRPIETIPHSVYESAAKHVQSHLAANTAIPQVAIMCGRGLQGTADKLEGPITIIPFTSIPGFAISTAISTAGKLVFGEILCIVGRCHYYEGYAMKQITFPVRVLALLGVRTLVHAQHLHFSLRKLAFSVYLEDKDMLKRGVRLKEAVYCYTTGPSSETRAECMALRALGAEVVGSSTVPEVIVAHHAGWIVAAQGAEPSAEDAVRAQMEGRATPALDSDDDLRMGLPRKGGQRPNELNHLVQRIVERL